MSLEFGSVLLKFSYYKYMKNPVNPRGERWQCGNRAI